MFPTEPLMLQFSATGTTHPKLATRRTGRRRWALCRRDGRPSREDRLLGDVCRRRQHWVDSNTVCVNPYELVDSRAYSNSESTALLCSLIFLIAESFPKCGAGRGTPFASKLHAMINL